MTDKVRNKAIHKSNFSAAWFLFLIVIFSVLHILYFVLFCAFERVFIFDFSTASIMFFLHWVWFERRFDKCRHLGWESKKM